MKDASHSSAFDIAHARVCELIDRFEKHARDACLLSGCAAPDRQIDAWVHELCGLGADEVALIGSSA